MVQEVEVINRAGKIIRKLANEFPYAYRHIEPKEPKEQTEKLDKLESMGFLAGIFKVESADETLDLQAPVRALLKKRNETQPIGTFNCGSVFRNPPGDHAARLIELCGLKGVKEGGAVVSPKHANFIINQDNATAEHTTSGLMTFQMPGPVREHAEGPAGCVSKVRHAPCSAAS